METLSEYTRDLYGAPDELLQGLPLDAQREGLPAIHIPDEVGRLLQVLIVSGGVRRVLELGTLFGYSALWMARVLPAGGRVISLEASPHHAAVARRNLERAGVSDRVEIREGAAIDSLRSLDGPAFDLVFIDADKINYVPYLDWALRLTRPGSLIVADNTWRHGEVIKNDGDENARAMAGFNRRIASEGRLISTMVPNRDGEDAVTVAVVR